MGPAQPAISWVAGGAGDVRLADGSPAWGGAVAGGVAIAVFLVFSTWVVVQRVRHGKDSNDE
jgi:hypothetical protein